MHAGRRASLLWLGSKIKIAVQNAQYRHWRRRHPGAMFKDYFATFVRDDVETGRLHPTLGGNLCNGCFGEAGSAAFRRLLRFGISPDDTCVDYGCGTLRVGVHAVRYLNPGRYWGLDIDQSLLDAGARLIGPEIMAESQTKLRIISPDTVKEVAAIRPAFLFSVAVLKHVHPGELEEYFGSILSIVGRSGKAIILGRWSADGTFQLTGQSWAHSLPSMKGMVDRLGGRLSVVKNNERHLTQRGVRGEALELCAKA